MTQFSCNISLDFYISFLYHCGSEMAHKENGKYQNINNSLSSLTSWVQLLFLLMHVFVAIKKYDSYNHDPRYFHYSTRNDGYQYITLCNGVDIYSTITIILTRVDLIKTSLSSIVCALLLRLKSYSFVVIIFSIN